MHRGPHENQCALTVQIGWGTQDTQFSIIVDRGGATGARKGRLGEIKEASQNRRILLVCPKEKVEQQERTCGSLGGYLWEGLGAQDR